VIEVQTQNASLVRFWPSAFWISNMFLARS
jgi:hypothetical protein